MTLFVRCRDSHCSAARESRRESDVAGVSLRGIGASARAAHFVIEDGCALNDPFGGWVYWAGCRRARSSALKAFVARIRVCTEVRRLRGGAVHPANAGGICIDGGSHRRIAGTTDASLFLSLSKTNGAAQHRSISSRPPLHARDAGAAAARRSRC